MSSQSRKIRRRHLQPAAPRPARHLFLLDEHGNSPFGAQELHRPKVVTVEQAGQLLLDFEVWGGLEPVLMPRDTRVDVVVARGYEDLPEQLSFDIDAPSGDLLVRRKDEEQ